LVQQFFTKLLSKPEYLEKWQSERTILHKGISKILPVLSEYFGWLEYRSGRRCPQKFIE